MATGPSLCQRVQICVACSDFQRKTCCSVSVHLPGVIDTYARTESINSTKKPEFATIFELDYHCEEEQRLWFRLTDTEFRLHDRENWFAELGVTTCTLAEIVGPSYISLEFKDAHTKEVVGTLHLRAEEVSDVELKEIDVQFAADGLDKKDFLGKSDPYLVFSRQNKDGSFSVVHRTEIFEVSLNPIWTSFRITSQQLCNNDPDRVIRVCCYDWDFCSSDDLIGYFDTTFAELEEAGRMEYDSRRTWECINPKKQSKKSYKNSGVVRLKYLKTTRIYSFSDYVRAGCQLHFTIAIDYTHVNFTDHTYSLHSLEPGKPNQYDKVLSAVGDVCRHYNASFHEFPAYGCGAEAGGEVPRVFPLNGNPDAPQCMGIGGVVEAYHNSLKTVELMQTCQVAPMISQMADSVSKAVEKDHFKQYSVLFLLTYGDISDMKVMKKAIIAASHLPMSVIVVGVGDTYSKVSREMATSYRHLDCGEKYPDRNIVQFVSSTNSWLHDAILAGAGLTDIPSHVKDYMKLNKISPQHLRDLEQ